MDSKGTDQPAHLGSLLRAFVVGCQNHWILLNVSMESKGLGPVVQSIVSLTSSLVIKMLTVLVNTVSYSQVFLLNKCE